MADALLAGATGLVGSALVQGWTGPGTLHLLVRRPIAAPGTHRQVHVVDYKALTPLPAVRDALCCLGTTIKTAGSPAAFRAVDHDTVLAFARAARAAGVQRFALVSALGANARSRTFYNRVKGEVEDALKAMDFASLVIARPSLLVGDRSTLGQAPRVAEHLALRLLGPVSGLIPAVWRPIPADTVARALRRALDDARPGVTVLESARLLSLGGLGTAH